MSRKDPKLLITIDEQHRGVCESEIRALLARADLRAELLPGAPDGLVEAWFPEDAHAAVARITELCKENPFQFAHTYRWIPVDAWTEPDKRHLRDHLARFDAKIEPDESWRVDVHKSHSALSSQALREAVAEFVDKPRVNLRSPDKTIHVELLGDRVGLSLLKPGELLSVGELTKAEFVEFEEVTRGPRSGRAGKDSKARHRGGAHAPRHR